MNRQISLALTHHNRYGMLRQAIANVIDDPRIGEIVISDDASNDGSFTKLEYFAQNNPKVKLFRNRNNLDCYRNKREAVTHCSFPWVILFDSDNVISIEYLNKIFAFEHWNPDVVYCPCFAEPHFDYRSFSGLMIDCKNVAELMERKHFPTALNTCNYFVNRESYLHVWKGDIDPHTADSLYQIYNWLRAEKKIYIVPDLHYFHRVHEGSHYKNNWRKTGNFMNELKERFKKLR